MGSWGARAAALREALIGWGIPLLPLLFLGIPLPDSEKTVSVPKLLLPALVALWAVGLRRADLDLARRPFAWAFLAYLGWVVLGVAADPRRDALWHLAEEALYVLLLAGAWTRPPVAGDDVWRRFRGVCALIAAAALILALADLPRSALPYRALGTPNAAAAFLVLALLNALAERRRGHAATFLAGMAALGSAGAWLGLLAGALPLARRRLLLLGAAAAAAGGLWLSSPSVPTPLGRHGYRVEAPPPDAFWKNSVEPRAYIARLSLVAAAERPWLGFGLGTYTEAFLDVERRRLPEAQMPWWRFGYPPREPWPPSAHNDVLRIAVESGLPAALLWLLGLAALAWEVRRRPLALGLLAAFLAQSMTDNLYQLSSYVPVLWTLVGIERDPPVRRPGLLRPSPPAPGG
jgi:O-antigen ligase